MRFSSVLKDLRREKGCSARELSLELNCSINLIYDWEHERCQPGYDTLIKIAKFFSVSIEYLLGVEDDFFVEEKPRDEKKDDLSETDKILLEKFYRLDLAAQKTIRDMISFYLKEKVNA